MLLLAGAALVFYRDLASAVSAWGPGEGSLIVNINVATQDELETIPGIGPAIAAEIIVHRPYEAVDDLRKVPGIGRKNLDRFRPFVITDGATRKR